MTDEFSWLDDEPTTAVVPATPNDSRIVKLIEDSRALPIRRRLYLRALCENQFSQTRAVRALQARGYKLARETTTRWQQDPLFQSLVERYQEMTLAAAGTSRAAVLLNFSALVDYGMDQETVYDKDGLPIDKKMRDPDLALSANDKLAKAARIYGEDAERQRPVVILDFSGERPAIDANAVEAEFVEVPPK